MPKPRKTYGQLTTRTRWANPMDELDALAISRCMGIARDAAPKGMNPEAVAAAAQAAFARCLLVVRRSHTFTVTGSPDGAGGTHLDATVRFASDHPGDIHRLHHEATDMSARSAPLHCSIAPHGSAREAAACTSAPRGDARPVASTCVR